MIKLYIIRKNRHSSGSGGNDKGVEVNGNDSSPNGGGVVVVPMIECGGWGVEVAMVAIAAFLAMQ